MESNHILVLLAVMFLIIVVVIQTNKHRYKPMTIDDFMSTKDYTKELDVVLKQTRANHTNIFLFYFGVLKNNYNTVCSTHEQFLNMISQESLITVIDENDKELVQKVENSCNYGYINEVFYEMLEAIALHPITVGEAFEISYDSWQTTQIEDRCKMLYTPIQQIAVDGSITPNRQDS